MKFCKNLQRVADLSNPEWSPYWTDYKRLKKIIKTLSELDLGDEPTAGQQQQQQQPSSSVSPPTGESAPKTSRTATTRTPRSTTRTPVATTRASSASPTTGPSRSSRRDDDTPRTQGQGDRTAEASPGRTRRRSQPPTRASAAAAAAAAAVPAPSPQNVPTTGRESQTSVESMKRSPGEVQFFKLLHAEFQKAVHFFDTVIEEYRIREERVIEGMKIVKNGNRFHLWTLLAKSVYRLHTDLLLLETFCIMTYCSFSKILKKHDKVTGFDTRNAFMSNVVNKANFSNYTTLQEMIGRCEELYSEVSDRMVQEGKQGLYEDERLFIEMIYQLNQQS